MVQFRDNPSTKHPFTVILVINPDSATTIQQVWAYDPNDAVFKAATQYNPDYAYERQDLQLLCVLYGHAERCTLEEDFRFRWFHPIL